MKAWQSALARWQKAGLLDAPAAERIRAWEAAQDEGGSSRFAVMVFTFGGLLLTAGVLLFVAAHWEAISPLARFALVLAMIAVFHGGGAIAAAKSAALASVLHAAGTGALGAGIFLTGQIFHMAEHWPGGLMLWALGAALGWLWLRDWPQLVYVALLGPAWLIGEWVALFGDDFGWRETTPIAIGTFLLACAYLFAAHGERREPWRRALSWLGAIAIIPAGAYLGMQGFEFPVAETGPEPSVGGAWQAVAWVAAIAIPAGVALLLRGRRAVFMAAAVAWALAVAALDGSADAEELLMYALFALGSAGLVGWGLKDGQRLAVNVGMLGFALSVAGFYFSSLYDKLGRALGLIGMGVLFLGGGWALERTRRRLLSRLGGGGR